VPQKPCHYDERQRFYDYNCVHVGSRLTDLNRDVFRFPTVERSLSRHARFAAASPLAESVPAHQSVAVITW
jgi:hypothetical protein